jgi:hypothetical protein
MNRDNFTEVELEYILNNIIWGFLSLPTEYHEDYWDFLIQGTGYNGCPVYLDDEDELYYTHPDTMCNFLKSCVELPLEKVPIALGRAESKHEHLTVDIFRYRLKIGK